MIPISAPTISANAAKPNGTAPSASPIGAEIADFAALLGAAGSAGEMPEAGVADVAAVLTAAFAGLPGGKNGNAAGKTLPVAELAGSGPAAIDDLETDEAPDEAISDQADVPIAAAVTALPLLVPPLPGAGTPAEFRAAGPDTAFGRAVVPPAVLPEQARPTAPKPVALLAEAIPANAGESRLSPVRRTTVTPQTEGAAGKEVAMRTAVRTITAQDAAATLPPGSALPASLREVQLAPIATVNVPQQTGTAGGAAAMRTTAQIAAAAAPTLPPVEPPAQRSAALQAVPGDASTPAAQVTAPLVASAATGTAAKGKGTEPQLPAVPDTAMNLLAEGGAELDGAALAMRPSAHHVSELSIAQPDAGVRVANAAPATTSTPASAEQPHDFATLVNRLSEAREAASPQVVRTALQHAEFGRISLQFRHDDASLSVTMANADPAFTSAVQGAVAATLAGNAAGNGDQPQGDRQQPQQPQTASQQQSATSGNGGQGQPAQARADQGERGFRRSQGSSAHAQQGGDTASSDRAATGARRSGIYA